MPVAMVAQPDSASTTMAKAVKHLVIRQPRANHIKDVFPITTFRTVGRVQSSEQASRSLFYKARMVTLPPINGFPGECCCALRHRGLIHRGFPAILSTYLSTNIEVLYMRIRHAVPMAIVLIGLIVSPVLAESTIRKPKTTRIAPAADLTFTCRSIRKAPKPFMEAVEDGVAYVLDIPLAMLSPLMCPIVSPIMERIDSGPDREFYPTARR